MNGNVVFYQLSRKFIHRGQDVPEASTQLIHYTLAIGHHIGIIDCFSSKLEVPSGRYADWIAHLPEGEARRKLEGLLRFGEIEISAPHAPLLQQALQATLADMSSEELEWTACLSSMLRCIAEEPALYLMARRS
jgi:hydrogenase-4 component J